MPEYETVSCANLDEGIDQYLRQGYRLVMITPADAPRNALMSKYGSAVKLCSTARRQTTNSGWITGRAGMMYRDLIPDRLGGKLIASHIRIVEGGDVPDSVHYHLIDLQLIYCLKGAIRVVYEDQGPPFWLMPGDCVLQPPAIRHRVLEAVAGSEVVELTSPGEHETWFDAGLPLPTQNRPLDRSFSGQIFLRHRDVQANWISKIDDLMEAETEIEPASNGLASVTTLRSENRSGDSISVVAKDPLTIVCLIDGRGIKVKFNNFEKLG